MNRKKWEREMERAEREWRQAFEDHLARKGIFFERLTNEVKAASLKQRWLRTFAGDANISGICTEPYMWHIFSFKRVGCYTEEEATKRFHAKRKKVCYLLFQHNDDAYVLKNPQAFTADDLCEHCDYMDVYVVDEFFRWTYVLTHEGDCGPYFCVAKKECV